jgi:hypothetical protein
MATTEEKMIKEIWCKMQKWLFQPEYLYDSKRELTELEKEDYASRQW